MHYADNDYANAGNAGLLNKFHQRIKTRTEKQLNAVVTAWSTTYSQ